MSKRSNWLVLVRDWMCGWDGDEEDINVKDNS